MRGYHDNIPPTTAIFHVESTDWSSLCASCVPQEVLAAIPLDCTAARVEVNLWKDEAVRERMCAGGRAFRAAKRVSFSGSGGTSQASSSSPQRESTLFHRLGVPLSYA